ACFGPEPRKECVMARSLGLVLPALGVLVLLAPADDRKLPEAKSVGRLETVATFDGPMPTGVTVSHKGRVFVNFPRWGDKVDFTVAELKNGKPGAYPDESLNRLDSDRPGHCLVSVQSVVISPDDRLWKLDSGRVAVGLTLPG